MYWAFLVSILVAISTLVTGCAPSKPEGPVEKIGKGLDQVMEGVRDIDENEQEVRERNRKKDIDPRYDYDSDEWWRERDRLNRDY